MDLVGALQRLPIWKLCRVNLYYIDILKLRTYELSYSVLHKYLLILRLSLHYGALLYPYKLVVLVETALTIC